MKKNQADYLSWQIKLLEVLDNFDVNIFKVKIFPAEDNILSTVKNFVQRGFPKDTKYLDPNIVTYFKHKDNLSIYDELLTYRNRIIVPDML